MTRSNVPYWSSELLKRLSNMIYPLIVPAAGIEPSSFSFSINLDQFELIWWLLSTHHNLDFNFTGERMTVGTLVAHPVTMSR